jgi:hypothetical protein
MNDLLELAVKAHGGLDRWQQLTEITAHVSISGTLWGRKGHPDALVDTHVKLDPHRQRITYDPFLHEGRRSVFLPDHTVIETQDGRLAAERHNPKASFAGHTSATPWDELHVAYFSGYAMWNYLTLPFLLTGPDFQSHELAANYSDKHRTFGGIVFPTRRRVLPRKPDGTTLPEPVLVSIDLLEVTAS